MKRKLFIFFSFAALFITFGILSQKNEVKAIVEQTIMINETKINLNYDDNGIKYYFDNGEYILELNDVNLNDIVNYTDYNQISVSSSTVNLIINVSGYCTIDGGIDNGGEGSKRGYGLFVDCNAELNIGTNANPCILEIKNYYSAIKVADGKSLTINTALDSSLVINNCEIGIHKI